MKKILALTTLALVSFALGWLTKSSGPTQVENGESKSTPKKETKLAKYSIESLTKANILPGKLEIGDLIKKSDKYESYLFKFGFDPEISSGQTKTTSGQINFPIDSDKHSVILMLRGYVDQQIYKTGTGTVHASEVFAKNGFITIAPDFLGYADSDTEAGNIFESRFQTYTTALTLLKTIEEIPQNPKLVKGPSQLENQLTNNSSIFLWGHSNGGQIALTILEASGADYPTTLWAPVCKPFPYSILYYTDEAEDKGKLIRSELSKFEQNYNVELFSLTNYLDLIKTTLQIHQGTSDDAVPLSWSNNLVGSLKNLDINVNYFTYPGTNHNMQPVWDTVVLKDTEFFNSFIEE